MAQEEITTIPVEKKQLKELQTYFVGDSLLVVIKERVNNLQVTQSLMISAAGEIEKIPLNDFFDDVDLIFAESTPDSVVFYYLIEPKQLRNTNPKFVYTSKPSSRGGSKPYVLRALMYAKSTHHLKISTRYVELPDKIVGIYSDRGLHFITADKKTSALELIHIRNLEIVGRQEVTLPKNFLNSEIKSLAVIQDDMEVQPWQAEASLKLYVHKNALDIVKEELLIGTTVVKFDFSKSNAILSRYMVPVSDRKPLSSYYHNGLLYRVSKGNGFDVRIYDSTQQIHTFSVGKTSAYKDSVGYLRASNSKRILKDRNVWDVVSNIDQPFISVYPLDSVRVMFKLGAHKRLVSGTPVLFPLGGVIAASVAIMAATILIRELSPTTVGSSDLYFYMKGNAATGFAYYKEPPLIWRQIDKKEMFDPEKPQDYLFKVYASRPGEVIAVYCKEKSKKDKGPTLIRVLRYSKPQ